MHGLQDSSTAHQEQPDYGVYLHGDIDAPTKLKLREKLVNLIRLEQGPRVLDVGCGRGLLAVGFAVSNLKCRVAAVDIWNELEIADNKPDWVIENARREKIQGSLEVQFGDVRRLPFDDQLFDLVVSNLVVHNLKEPDQQVSFNEMHRVLKRGGWMLYSDIDKRDQFLKARAMVAKAGFGNLTIQQVLTLFSEPAHVGICALIARKN